MVESPDHADRPNQFLSLERKTHAYRLRRRWDVRDPTRITKQDDFVPERISLTHLQ